jgi:predicted peptidase
MLQWSVTASADDSATKDMRHGQFEVTFTPAQLLDDASIDRMSPAIGADEEITWNMYVPESYDANKPAGLIVYISPSKKGSVPRKWKSVIDDENFIWISANQSGNDIDPSKRLLYAVLGPQIASRNYEIDSARVYLSGFSGGAMVASIVAIDFANLFKGAIYICGALPWEKNPPVLFEQISANRYVFLSGDNDFNLESVKSVHQQYKEAGLSRITMIRIPRMGHDNPDTKGFRKAIKFLDDRE